MSDLLYLYWTLRRWFPSPRNRRNGEKRKRTVPPPVISTLYGVVQNVFLDLFTMEYRLAFLRSMGRAVKNSTRLGEVLINERKIHIVFTVLHLCVCIYCKFSKIYSERISTEMHIDQREPKRRIGRKFFFFLTLRLRFNPFIKFEQVRYDDGTV